MLGDQEEEGRAHTPPQKKAPCRSRWRMRGLRIPSFGRSRSSDSRDHSARRGRSSADESDRAASAEAPRNSEDAEGRLSEGGRTGGKTLSGPFSFWKRKSANITEYDATYRVVYLGNVLTGWAKGEGCVDKPLSTLWRNHIGSDKPDIMMKVTVVNSGLSAATKEHGVTEYWANRITYCTAHPSYPRVFCWIYRHEGRKMKQELRCHAVLCPRGETARSMALNLQERLHQALVDFRKEKIWRQNARLSLANCLQDNPSMPYRKLLLQAGTTNYKPPIERSKSAPKLTAIEEAEFEEEEEEEYDEDVEEEEEEEYGTSLSSVVETHSDPDRLGSNSKQEVVVVVGVSHIPAASPSALYAQDEENEEKDDHEEEAAVVRQLHEDGAAIAARGLHDHEEEEEVDSAQQSQSVSPASQGRSSSAGAGSVCSSASAHRRQRCRCHRRSRRHHSPSSSTTNHRDNDDDEDEDDHSLSSDHSDSGHGGEEDYHHRGMAQGKRKVSEQDAISDESGYSEEPIMPPVAGASAAAAATAAAADSVTMLAVNLTTVVGSSCPSSSPSPPPPPSQLDSEDTKSDGDHRLEIVLTNDNCIVSNNNNNNSHVTNNNNSSGGATVTSKNLTESSRLQAVRRTSATAKFENGRIGETVIGDCLTPPRTPDLSPPLPPATLVMRRPSVTSPTSPPPPLLPRPTDLTVRSVLLSEFTTSEKLRYIERSNLKTGGGGGGVGGKSAASLLLNRQEFCINI